MYTIHQEILTPVRAAPGGPLAPIENYYSVVHVSVGGVELYYKMVTDPRAFDVYGKHRVQQHVVAALRKGIMYEIERHLFQIDAYGDAMGPQL